MPEPDTADRNAERTFEGVEAIRKRHEHALMEKTNVMGVGVGVRMQGGVPTGEVALVVLVTEKVPATQLLDKDVIPTELEGVPVDVHIVGDITAQSENTPE